MATIVQRGKKYAVVYTYKDKNGKASQKWESFDTRAEARKRKNQVEYFIDNNMFEAPTVKTMRELLDQFVKVYGMSNWAMSTYETNMGLINNYILPTIGDRKISEITPLFIDNYYKALRKVPTVRTKNKTKKDDVKYLSPHCIRDIHKVIHSAFKQAKKWGTVQSNPADDAILPEVESEEREIWTVETLRKALSLCDDDILALAINLSFSCSLRIGEMLGLTWDCVDISKDKIQENACSIFVNKEIQRVSKKTMNTLEEKDVIRVFPNEKIDSKSVVVLKTPKTKSSVRKIYLPQTVATMLEIRRSQIEEIKAVYGSEFLDYNLVFCNTNGRPMEEKTIMKKLKKLISDNDLPEVVFHSLRHSSVTYKLKWSGGDMKAVQGDSGHASISMIANVYSHIIDEDRKINAQIFNDNFYNNADLPDGLLPTTEILQPNENSIVAPDPIEPENTTEQQDTLSVLTKILQNPDAMVLLKALAGTIK